MSEAKSETTSTSTSGAQQPQQAQEQEQQVVLPAESSTATATAAAATSEHKTVDVAAKNLNSLEYPLLLEHASLESVPQHLKNLTDQSKDRKVSPAAWLTLLIYSIALECGFVEEDVYAQKRHLLQPVPAFSSFHAPNVRLLSEQFVNYSCLFNDTAFSIRLRTLLDKYAPEDATLVTALQSRLMAIILGDQLMVTLSPAPPSKQPGYSISLSIGRYVLNIQSKNKPIYQRFRKLDELSYQIKQNLFQPMRSQQLLEMNQKLQPSLLGLPDELYGQIFKYLNRSQLNVVGKVNRQLNFHSKEAERKRLQGGRR